MNLYDKQLTALRGVVFAMLMLAPALTWACCPSDDKGAPKAASGLGEPIPLAVDLAADAAWQIYALDHDGIRYILISDSAGAVRAAVGHSGGAVSVLPIGRDAARVLLPGDALPSGQYRVLSRSNALEVVLIDSAGAQYWWVRVSAPSN